MVKARQDEGTWGTQNDKELKAAEDFAISNLQRAHENRGEMLKL